MGRRQDRPSRMIKSTKSETCLILFPTVCVRYDPANPVASRVLNEDNPRFPFEIDHLEH